VPVTIPNPPYALTPTVFRFPALASLAGRAPLGGRREVVIATYLAARLAHDTLASRGVSQETRAERAGHARSWLANIALPANVRPALSKLVDLSGGPAKEVGGGIRVVMAVTASYLDKNAQLELDQLANALDSDPTPD
jgi:hypothetical protein